MARPPNYPDSTPLLDRAVDLLLNRSRRIPLLIAVAYVSGLSGIGVSLAGAGDPNSSLTAVGIVLMGIAFVCLFVVSITFVRISDPDRQR